MPEDDPDSALREPLPDRPVAPGALEAIADGRLKEAIQDMLATAHRHNAKAPIKGPDEYGAFPASNGRAWGLGTVGVPPVVLDSNLLRGASWEEEYLPLVRVVESEQRRRFAPLRRFRMSSKRWPSIGGGDQNGPFHGGRPGSRLG
jgi:hypothetical protein